MHCVANALVEKSYEFILKSEYFEELLVDNDYISFFSFSCYFGFN
jgi:hypothetical protein